MHLADVTWTDVAAAEADVGIVPVGSTEQHGPHAPLSTDTLTAATVADAAAERYDDEVLVAPAIPVGVAEEHRHFDGTLWVSEDAFRRYVAEVARSLASHGVERIVLANGHGGNVAALREVASRLTRDGDAYVVPFTWFDAVDAPDVGHGGPVETSVVLAAAPDLVREDRLAEAAAGASDGWGEWVAGVNLAFDSAAFTESGAVGDPGDADPERGEALIDAAADALVRVLEAMAERQGPEPDAESE